MILPHEHIFVDLRLPDHPHHSAAPPEEVVALMAPQLERARAAGVTALVAATPVGVGRRVDLVQAVSFAANFPIVVPTGIYREPWVPDFAYGATHTELRGWMLDELMFGIEDTGVQAGWIKLSAGDEGITEVEKKILRSAALAGAATNAVIGSHTVRGEVVLEQLRLVEETGYTPQRFIWIHTQAEPDFDLHLQVALRGAWLEYDNIGAEDFADEVHVERILRLLDRGLGDRLLLSHDRGWYDPAQPGGGTPRPFTYLSEVFLPKLRAAGVDEATIERITRDNPFRAFAR
jgi:phosphotriesterase-related protein